MRTVTQHELEKTSAAGIVVCNTLSSCVSFGFTLYSAGKAAVEFVTDAIAHGDTVNIQVDAMGNFTGWSVNDDDDGTDSTEN